MTDDSAPSTTALPGRDERQVRMAAAVGISLALLGVIDGLVMALNHHVVSCPNGTISYGNQPAVCHSYPHAGLGIAVMLFSGLLGIVVVLAAVAAVAVVRGSSEDVQASSDGSPAVPRKAT